MLKYLRIAVTTLALTACVLLIVLWVRSYFYSDFVLLQSHSMEWVASSQFGNVFFNVNDGDPSAPRWTYFSLAAGPRGLKRLPPGFNFKYGSGSVYGYVPHWFLVLLSATLAALPWIKWRFSLRTMLIGMTLIAVVLGIAMTL